jgi:hypothetical protein
VATGGQSTTGDWLRGGCRLHTTRRGVADYTRAGTRAMRHLDDGLRHKNGVAQRRLHERRGGHPQRQRLCLCPPAFSFHGWVRLPARAALPCCAGLPRQLSALDRRGRSLAPRLRQNSAAVLSTASNIYVCYFLFLRILSARERAPRGCFQLTRLLHQRAHRVPAKGTRGRSGRGGLGGGRGGLKLHTQLARRRIRGARAA